jgi:exonuclease SbcC
MQLLRLEVKNWVHHRQQTCEFTRGLVAILGENGSGKSSLFGAIRWLLTGENPNYGVKADNISQYAKPGEPSFARLEFEHNGHIAVVTRHLLPDKEPSTLLVDGTEVARGDKAVTAGIEKLLGVDAKFISRFIIVGQTDIFSFIDDNQTETDKFFQRLFNTAKADKCQDAIGKSVAKISVPEVLDPAAQIEKRHGELLQSRNTLADEIDALPTFESFLATQKTDQETISEWNKRDQAAKELAALDEQEKQYRDQLTPVQETIDQYDADLSALDSAVNGQDSAYADARTALAHWENYKRISAAQAAFAADKETIEQERKKDPEPPAVSRDDVTIAESAYKYAQQEFKRADAVVATFDSSGVTECPTCHTPTDNIMNYVDDMRSRIPQLVKEMERAGREFDEKRAEFDAYEKWQKRESTRTARLAQLDEAAAKLSTVPPPDNTEDELKQTVNEYEEFRKVRQEIAPLAQQAKEQKAKLEGTLTGIEQRKQELQSAIVNIKVTQADEFLAKTRLTQLQEKFAERQKMSQRLAEMDFEAKQLHEQYESARKAEESAVLLREWVGVAEQAREALKSAPRLVAQRNLQRLESAINEILQIFAVNFSVKVAADGTLTFLAEFFDGRKQVAQRLSVGQKTVLALAFRVACNAMFAEEIGLLALDEPTASLDAPRIRALAPVLEKLRDLSTAKGLQCLLVTHATGLSHLFESAITLDPPETRNATIQNR